MFAFTLEVMFMQMLPNKLIDRENQGLNAFVVSAVMVSLLATSMTHLGIRVLEEGPCKPGWRVYIVE